MKIRVFFTTFFATFTSFFHDFRDFSCLDVFDAFPVYHWDCSRQICVIFSQKFVIFDDFFRFVAIFSRFFAIFFVLMLISLESWIGKKGCKLAFFCVVLRWIFNAYFDGHFLSKTAFSACHWDFSRQIFVLFFRQNSWFFVIFHYFFAIFCTKFDEFLARYLSWFAKNTHRILNEKHV